MKNQKQLINNIVGQLNGVAKMVEEGQDCFKVLTQMKASRSALDSMITKYLEENLFKCLSGCKGKDKEDVCKKFFAEALKYS